MRLKEFKQDKERANWAKFNQFLNISFNKKANV